MQNSLLRVTTSVCKEKLIAANFTGKGFKSVELFDFISEICIINYL